MKDKELTLQQIAEKYGVTYVTISNWIKNGLKFSTKKKIGRKAFKVTTINNVEDYLNGQNYG